MKLGHYIVVVVLIAVALPACSSLTSETPPVADSTLVDVLVGLHLAEARADLRGDLPVALRDSILADNGLDTVQFRAALDYYTEYPDDYLDLYSDVLDRLAAEQAALRDSLMQPPLVGGEAQR